MKRRILLSLIFCIACLFRVGATGDPLFSSPRANLLYHNPGYSLSDEKRSLFVSGRADWLKLDDRPVSSLAVYNAPLRQADNNIGVLCAYNRNGYLATAEGLFFYNYRIKTGRRSNLKIGTSMALVQKTIDFNKFPEKEKDFLILHTRLSDMQPDFGIGAFYNAEGFFAGISVRHLIESVYEYETVASFHMNRTMYVTLGYKLPLNSNLNVTVSGFLRKMNVQSTLDVNAVFNYKNLLEAGLLYRGGHAISPFGFYGGTRMGKELFMYAAVDFSRHASMGSSMEGGLIYMF